MYFISSFLSNLSHEATQELIQGVTLIQRKAKTVLLVQTPKMLPQGGRDDMTQASFCPSETSAGHI